MPAPHNPTYASRSTAMRGAKRAGIETPIVVETDDGRFEVRDGARPLYNGAARERSTVEGPVSYMWNLFIEYGEKLSRKELIARGVEAGVAINTAKTQYGMWRRATSEQGEAS